MSTYFVYMLFDNVAQVPLYVGATKSLKPRLSTHMGTTLKNYSNSNSVTIDVLEESDKNNVVFLEQFWFNQIKSWGFDLIQKNCRVYRQPTNTKYSHYEVALLSIAFEKSPQTIERWIKLNDDRLTSEKAKTALSKNKFKRL